MRINGKAEFVGEVAATGASLARSRGGTRKMVDAVRRVTARCEAKKNRGGFEEDVYNKERREWQKEKADLRLEFRIGKENQIQTKDFKKHFFPGNSGNFTSARDRDTERTRSTNVIQTSHGASRVPIAEPDWLLRSTSCSRISELGWT